MQKADKWEVDAYVSAVSSQKRDFDAWLQILEKDTASILRELKEEVI